jgi:hypothetical protein
MRGCGPGGGSFNPLAATDLKPKSASGPTPSHTVADPNGQVKIGAAFGNFEIWCAKHGHGHLLKSITLKNLRSYLRKVPGFEHVTTCRPNGSPVRYWAGIRLRKADEENGASFDDIA